MSARGGMREGLAARYRRGGMGPAPAARSRGLRAEARGCGRPRMTSAGLCNGAEHMARGRQGGCGRRRAALLRAWGRLCWSAVSGGAARTSGLGVVAKGAVVPVLKRRVAWEE